MGSLWPSLVLPPLCAQCLLLSSLVQQQQPPPEEEPGRRRCFQVCSQKREERAEQSEGLSGSSCHVRLVACQLWTSREALLVSCSRAMLQAQGRLRKPAFSLNIMWHGEEANPQVRRAQPLPCLASLSVCLLIGVPCTCRGCLSSARTLVLHVQPMQSAPHFLRVQSHVDYKCVLFAQACAHSVL